MTAPDGPRVRVVEVHELVSGWPRSMRESFAYWVASIHPEVVDEFDTLVRRLETRRALRDAARRLEE